MPIEILLLALKLAADLDAFLQNKEIQNLLNDEELIDAALMKLDKNAEESARIKAKLQALIAS